MCREDECVRFRQLLRALCSRDPPEELDGLGETSLRPDLAQLRADLAIARDSERMLQLRPLRQLPGRIDELG